jgi:phenylpropionate dioxygenase-like ring-hydroxylating dioxygenase large terminal subunit
MSILCDRPALRRSWHPVARVADVSGPLAVTLLGEELVLWRDAAGAVVAAPDRCTHREAPLSAGSVDRGCLTCPYHGWVFGEQGRCVKVPSSAEGVPVPPKAHLRTLPVQERYGLVWVALEQPDRDIADMPWDRDPSFRRINTPVEVWRTSVTRMTDNFCDMTHFPFVHTGTFGKGQDPYVPKFELESLPDEFYGFTFEVMAYNESAGTTASGQTSDRVHRVMTTGFTLPFTVRSTIKYDTGLEHILLLLGTPIDDVTSYFTFVVWRNDDFSSPADEAVKLDMAIGAEDKVLLERLKGVLPLDQTSLVSVQADRCSVEWRRRFAEMIA